MIDRTKEEIEVIKEKNGPEKDCTVDNLIMMAFEAGFHEKEEVMAYIESELTKIGNELMHRAILEEVVTEKDWYYMKNELELQLYELTPVLQGHFALKDGRIKTQPMLLTVDDSRLWIHRKYLENMFNITFTISIEDYEK